MSIFTRIYAYLSFLCRLYFFVRPGLFARNKITTLAVHSFFNLYYEEKFTQMLVPSVRHVVCRIVGLFGRQYGTDEKNGVYGDRIRIDEPWQYRVTLGEAVGDAIAVTEPKTEVSVVIGSNYSKEPRAVVVEMAVTEDAATPPPGGFGSSRLNRSLP